MTDRRNFLTNLGGFTAAALTLNSQADEKKSEPVPAAQAIPQPGRISNILFSCKFTMTKGNSIEERFNSVKEAGYDGIDFDDCGNYTVEQVKNASYQTGLFVHNAINHSHWKFKFTSAKESDITAAKKNLEHCLRVSHGAGGSGVLLVIGHGKDGTKEETVSRAHQHIKEFLPLAAALGQRILVENVWNSMFYEHGGSSEQNCQELIDFIDSFKSPWVGSYFDIGNHHRYGNMANWFRALGSRAVKLDMKGYNLKKVQGSKNDYSGFCDILEGDIDWAEIRKAIAEVNFNGWTTAEVGGGDTARLKKILDDMKKALLG